MLIHLCMTYHYIPEFIAHIHHQKWCKVSDDRRTATNIKPWFDRPIGNVHKQNAIIFNQCIDLNKNVMSIWRFQIMPSFRKRKKWHGVGLDNNSFLMKFGLCYEIPGTGRYCVKYYITSDISYDMLVSNCYYLTYTPYRTKMKMGDIVTFKLDLKSNDKDGYGQFMCWINDEKLPGAEIIKKSKHIKYRFCIELVNDQDCVRLLSYQER